MRRKLMIGALAILCGLGLILSAQTRTDETQYSVPELEAFHDIIYPMWHTAYPGKDLAALKGFVPEIDRMSKAILAAALPGILRESRDDWDKALPNFRKAVEDYDRAAAGEDGQALLDAAEALHSAYEMLVRVTRPLPKEVMEFHQSLYVVYHTDLPNKGFAKIRAEGAVLLTKAEAVVGLKLSQRFESKKAEFDSAAAALLESVKALTAVAAGNDAGLAQAVEAVHGRYGALQKVFE